MSRNNNNAISTAVADALLRTPAVEMRYLPIDPARVPYRFSVELGGRLFGLRVDYNDEADTYTVDLYDREGDLIAAGEPLVYGQPLWLAIADRRFPPVALVPGDLSRIETAVTAANLGRAVKVYIVTEEDVTDVTGNGTA